MSNSSNAFLDTFPEPIPPPEGIEANFDAPNTNGTVYIVIAVIGMLLATLFTLVRIYTKAILTRSLGWDDCKASLSFFLTLFLHPPQAEDGGRNLGI